MSSQSILKNGLKSPARSLMTTNTNGRRRPQSIMKRPAPLPMSPGPFPFANFSVLVSPSLKTPHVQFASTPELVATFTTHSKDTYDRAPIKISPNPLELPSRGERYYSPSLANFKLSAPPKPKAAVQRRLDSILMNAQQCASPAITDFEDPRSPKPRVTAAGMGTAGLGQVRFASFVASPGARQPVDLGISLGSYPRSPYPSAAEFSEEAKGQQPRRRLSLDEGSAPRKQSKAAQRVSVPFTPIPSPLKSTFSARSAHPPGTAGLQRAHKPAPLAIEPENDSAALSDAFWNAVSLEDGSAASGEIDSPMVTALEYPESANSNTMMMEVDLRSPGPASVAQQQHQSLKSPGPAVLMFGMHDGAVWEPPSTSNLLSPSAAARPGTPAARERLLRGALMSPGKAAFGFNRGAGRAAAKRSVITAPSPNDPFAAFPSFAAALSMAPSDPAVAYPARAVVAGN